MLAFVASVLSKTANEPVFRYGGEEFTILFPKITVKDCWDHLNEICEAVAQSKFKIRRQSSKTNGTERLVSVTISIGVAEQGLKHSSFKEVLKAADRALYRAKKKGRNCVSK